MFEVLSAHKKLP